MSKKKILIIDDNHEVRDMLNDMLTFKGYTVSTAESGIEISKIIRETPPDLIICDISMPDKDGFQVLEEVRSSSNHPDVKFVFLTASMLRSEEEKIINVSADGYLMKPYNSTQLFQLLDKLLVDDNSET